MCFYHPAESFVSKPADAFQLVFEQKPCVDRNFQNCSLLVQKYYLFAKRHGFVEYYRKNPSTGKEDAKIIYFMKIPDFNYFIVAGLYLHDVI